MKKCEDLFRFMNWILFELQVAVQFQFKHVPVGLYGVEWKLLCGDGG